MHDVTMNFSLKPLTLFAMVCALAAPALRADDAPPPPPPQDGAPAHAGHMKEHRLKQLVDKLNLTADQQSQVSAILDKVEAKLKAIHDDASIAREDKRAQANEARKAGDVEIRALLTPDQQKIFDTLKPERGPHEKGKRSHEAPPPGDEVPPPPPPPQDKAT